MRGFGRQSSHGRVYSTATPSSRAVARGSGNPPSCIHAGSRSSGCGPPGKQLWGWFSGRGAAARPRKAAGEATDRVLQLLQSDAGVAAASGGGEDRTQGGVRRGAGEVEQAGRVSVAHLFDRGNAGRRGHVRVVDRLWRRRTEPDAQ